MKACSCSGLSSIDTPTITRPLSLYFEYSSTNEGISTLQGPHHVAQKLRMTTLPLKSVIFTGTLYSFFSTKSYFARPSASQAGFPFAADGTSAETPFDVMDVRDVR